MLVRYMYETEHHFFGLTVWMKYRRFKLHLEGGKGIIGWLCVLNLKHLAK